MEVSLQRKPESRPSSCAPHQPPQQKKSPSPSYFSSPFLLPWASPTVSFSVSILLNCCPSPCASPSASLLRQFSLSHPSSSFALLRSHCRVSMRTSIIACLIVLVALMASFAGGHAYHGRIGIHSAVDGRWPDLVGRDAEEAKTHILSERPNLNVQIVSSRAMMTMDYNTNRVRIFVNDEQKVVKCPTIG